MEPCPYCMTPIDEEILAWGGDCPACGIEIAGEEAPTDPGARHDEIAALNAAMDQPSKKPLFIAVGVVALLVVAAGGWFAMSGGDGEVLADGEFPTEMPKIDMEHPDDVAVGPRRAAPAPAPEEAGGSGVARPQARKGSSSALMAGLDNIEIDEPDVDPLIPVKTERADEPEKREEIARLAPKREESPATGARTETVMAPSIEMAGADMIIPASAPLSASTMAVSPLDAFKVDTDVSGRGPEAVVLSDPTEIATMVRRVLERGARQLRQCYEKQLKVEPNLAGAWQVSLLLSSKGTPTDIDVEALEDSNAELESCMRRNVQTWSFQAINEPLEVNKVFRFGKR